MWILKYDTNELLYKIETDYDIENRLVAVKRQEAWGMDWEFGISRYKLFYIGWINNKVLLPRELHSISCDKSL